MNMLSDTAPALGADTLHHPGLRDMRLDLLVDGHMVPPLWHLHIMWDIDDVVMPWARPVHDAAAALGFHDGTRDWSGWSMWESLGYTKTEWLEAVSHATANGLYETPPYDDALFGARRLANAGARNHVVTARGFMANAENIRRWTDQYLEVHGFPWHSRTFARNKADAMKVVLRHDQLRRLGYPSDNLPRFDYAIDDSMKNYEVLDAAGVRVYLRSQPHNLHEDVPDDRRVESVTEFVDTIFTRETR